MARKVVDCKCFKDVNGQLEKSDVVLDSAFQIGNGKADIAGPLIAVKWKTKKRTSKRLPIIVCAYCPFCGKKKPD